MPKANTLTKLFYCCLLLGLAVFSATAQVRQAVQLEAHFLNRGQLPGDFRFPLLQLGFGVLQLHFTNQGSEAWSTPAEVEVTLPKGKLLKRVRPTEVTPKIMNSKIYRPETRRRVHGDVGIGVGTPRPTSGPVPTYPRRLPGPQGAGEVSATLGQEIRSLLEAYELRELSLEPGESLTMLVYVKTNKKPSQLVGSRVRVAGLGWVVTE